jgi:hypothetical protein
MRVRRLATVLAMTSAALVVVASASAVEATINPGVGIGKVKLGMSVAQVKKALGKWSYVNERKGNHLSVGWGFAEWTIEFVSGKVVQVATSHRTQRTISHIGTGSTWRALVRAYPNGTCAWYGGAKGGPAPVEYLVQSKKGTQTIFSLRYPTQPVGTTEPVRWTVTEVSVRTRWQVLPEFGKAWQPHCRADWRTSDAPL